jgi:hypothetical protein
MTTSYGTLGDEELTGVLLLLWRIPLRVFFDFKEDPISPWMKTQASDLEHSTPLLALKEYSSDRKESVKLKIFGNHHAMARLETRIINFLIFTKQHTRENFQTFTDHVRYCFI